MYTFLFKSTNFYFYTRNNLAVFSVSAFKPDILYDANQKII